MGKSEQNFSENLDQNAALRMILEGTASQTGEQFFAALVENLAKALNTKGAWISEYFEEVQRLRVLAFWFDEQIEDPFEYDVAGTPCEKVLESDDLQLYSDNLSGLFPDDPYLEPFGAVSYMGVPLLDVDGKILGHLAVQDSNPMPEESRNLDLFKIFAARAAAELQRLRAECDIREREEKLGRLVDSAMDAIIEIDRDFKITRVNAATEKVFKCTNDELIGEDFQRFLTPASHEKLTSLIETLNSRSEGQRYLWIPGGLEALCEDGKVFPAEATLSHFEMHRESFYTLILRNVNERMAAEEKIRELTVEAEYLREEIKALHNFDEIIGQCKPLLEVLRDVEQVADTEATVLILGETGTGKEVIARAVHGASQRKGKPLIRVNCPAIPASLIESEFFGHEKGAFTGATAKRDGRFTLADGGTIFLDEVGELPLDLQVKLLRVLQEGEFEAVGSSQTRQVDVRVIAATNRDLFQEVQEGKFREDLYYRLNVFPIKVPPLRDRGNDIDLLAASFAEKFAHKLGRSLEPLSQSDFQRLKAYDWPGNVRELQNVIERAVITSRDGRLNLNRALPETGKDALPSATDSSSGIDNRIHTAHELLQLERENIIRALKSCNWKVAGEKGAASLLGIPSSTLSSRMKTLDIKRPN